MKKLLCLIISVMMFISANTVNTFAIQDDVKAAYANELQWLNKTTNLAEYCVYDINKDGYKELIVKIGTCEADYMYRFYSCSYGKIVSLGSFVGGHSGLYECDKNGVFVYESHMGYENLYRISKEGNRIKSTKIFSNNLNPLLDRGYYDPWHEPKKPINVTYVDLYGFSLSGLY